MGRTLISGGTILTPSESLTDHGLVIDGSRIASIQPGTIDLLSSGDRVIDASGCWVIPGLIDLHIHGANGHDTMDATPEAIQELGRFLARRGVTSYLPTTVTADREHLQRAIDNVARCPQPSDGARHMGVHLEGPYLDPNHRGAQSAQHLRLPDPVEYDRWLSSAAVRLITIAPELEGISDLVLKGQEAGVVFAAGHTGASLEQMRIAAEAGVDQATHVFNGMPPLHHRAPGAVGAILTDERFTVHLIVDGVHLHPEVVSLVVALKGPGRTILMSDAIRAAGLGEGPHRLGDQTIHVEGGVSRTTEGGLAGATVCLDEALRNAVAYTGRPINDCVAMATSTPAAVMGWGSKGNLSPGADADIVILDAEMRVRSTLVAGEEIFTNNKENQA
jgi:N-acetylglucosamine-6-phosphate deacetylase